MVKLTGNHSGPLNVRAAFTLNGVHEGNASDLIELMRSEEVIDRQTRNAIADALERKSGVRLEFKKGNTAPLLTTTKTRLLWQEIADDVAARIDAGELEKNAKRDVAKERKISPRTVGTAWSWRKRAPYRITCEKRGEA